MGESPTAGRRRQLQEDDSATDPVEAIRQVIESSLSTDLDDDLVEYRCPNCQERCINPRGSVLHEAGVCLECHAHYAAHGHLRGRISSRWDR